MEQWLFLFLVFVLASMAIVLIALLVNERLRARIFLPGKAEFFIDTSRSGWRKAPKSAPVWRRAERQRRDRRPYRTWLAVKVRGQPDWEYGLDGKTQVYIGRRPDNDIVLRDPAADARHAVIYLREGRYRINNLSRKGTKVNNRWITWQKLDNGNKIQMGNTVSIFREGRQ